MDLEQKQSAGTGKATITNMGAEIGATCSIFPYDNTMEIYLRTTGRRSIADLANKHSELLTQDSEIEKEIGENRENAIKYFDQLIESTSLNLNLIL